LEKAHFVDCKINGHLSDRLTDVGPLKGQTLKLILDITLLQTAMSSTMTFADDKKPIYLPLFVLYCFLSK